MQGNHGIRGLMNIQEIVPGRPIEAAAGFPYREQRREQSFIW